MRLLNRFSRFAFLALFLAASASCGAAQDNVETTSVPLIVGSDTVHVLLHVSEEPGLTYVNLHDDENTAVSAAEAVIGAHGGRLIELRHSGERIVRFTLGGEEYAFDPNRIFTPDGIDSTLATYGAVSDSARALTASFSDRLLELIGVDTLNLIVTVHNNTPGNYTVRSYSDEGPFERDARFVHITAGLDEDDFFFVTTEPVYAALRDGGFNVVMQHENLVTDDGSLSVLAGRQGVPYINVEAEHGHFETQEHMLTYVHELMAGE